MKRLKTEKVKRKWKSSPHLQALVIKLVLFDPFIMGSSPFCHYKIKILSWRRSRCAFLTVAAGVQECVKPVRTCVFIWTEHRLSRQRPERDSLWMSAAVSFIKISVSLICNCKYCVHFQLIASFIKTKSWHFICQLCANYSLKQIRKCDLQNVNIAKNENQISAVIYKCWICNGKKKKSPTSVAMLVALISCDRCGKGTTWRLLKYGQIPEAFLRLI